MGRGRGQRQVSGVREENGGRSWLLAAGEAPEASNANQGGNRGLPPPPGLSEHSPHSHDRRPPRPLPSPLEATRWAVSVRRGPLKTSQEGNDQKNATSVGQQWITTTIITTSVGQQNISSLTPMPPNNFAGGKNFPGEIFRNIISASKDEEGSRSDPFR